jgi:pyruvate-formate lyase-activating enzyme
MASRSEPRATILSVQHFCMHDGPGVRSVVFFKGCSLRCAWCCNPESWSAEPQLAYKPSLGLVVLGESESVEGLLAKLRPEFRLYAETGGGVTFSGGEATRQAAFAAELGRRLRAEGVHVALETSGMYQADAPELVALLANLDLVLFDVKLFDDDEHRRWCGAGNHTIKANLEALLAAALAGRTPAVWPRMPLIPTVTATEANVRGWGQWLAERGATSVTLVPYHEYGAGKREWLGLPEAPSFPLPDAPLIAQVREWFASYGLQAPLPGLE